MIVTNNLAIIYYSAACTDCKVDRNWKAPKVLVTVFNIKFKIQLQSGAWICIRSKNTYLHSLLSSECQLWKCSTNIFKQQNQPLYFVIKLEIIKQKKCEHLYIQSKILRCRAVQKFRVLHN